MRVPLSWCGVAEIPIEDLPRSSCREKSTGREFAAVRIDGWIVWDSQGPSLVSLDEFEQYYESADSSTEDDVGELG